MGDLKIFIVEDDDVYAEFLNYHLSLYTEYKVETFADGYSLLQNLFQNPSLVLLDYSLPDIGGIELLRKLKEYDSELPVVIVSGQEDINTAVNLLKEGAYDYIVKDKETKRRLYGMLKNLSERMRLKQELDSLKNEIGRKYSFQQIIKGNSPAIKKIYSLIEKAINTNITVSISGETGTGKELVAKSIHYNSYRNRFPFIPINVAAIPHDLIESELFGYEKGAFTGADTRKAGKFEAANKGSLFFDEIAEMDLLMQSKLLRVIQEREFTRIGGNDPIKVDIRFIVASNKDLAEEVKKGNFREDLYYRLLGLPIDLPPLRYRGDDILLLAKYFIDEFCKENKIKRKTISPAARKKLSEYNYPGNVRELKAIIELAVVLSNNADIQAEDINIKDLHSSFDIFDGEKSLKEYKMDIIRYYMEKYNNNVVLVAKKLKIGKSSIYRMLQNNEF